MSVSSRSVLVTGASKGIGQAVAERLAMDGFDICIHYNSDRAGAETTAQLVEQAGRKATLVQFDVTDHDVVKNVLEAYIQEHGAFYGVVVNAGITRDAAFPMMTQDDWNSVIRTDLDGFYNVVNPCIMPMISAKKGGRIVVVSSVSGISGNRGQVNYSAAKAGLIGAAKALSVELAKRKITVNCVAPGLISTSMTDLEPAVIEHAMAMVPMKRMGSPKEVAHCVSFLVSDGASYVTRQVLSVNGGML